MVLQSKNYVARGKKILLIPSVVQRTLHLYKTTNSLNTAYQQTLQEFYKCRREEEEVKLQAQNQEYTTGLEMWKKEMKEKKLEDPEFVVPKEPEYFFGRANVKNFMEKERLELAEGLTFRKSLLEDFELNNSQDNSSFAGDRPRRAKTFAHDI
jgi:Mitochondrial ribosomal protein S25